MNLLKAIGYTLLKWILVILIMIVTGTVLAISLQWMADGLVHLFGRHVVGGLLLIVIGVCGVFIFVMEVMEAYEEKFKED